MSSQNYNIGCEEDSTDKSSGNVIMVFIVLGVSLFLIMWGLVIMFRFQLGYEQEEKIGHISTEEALDAKAMAESYLSGKQGVFSDKKFVSIEEAKRQFLFDFRK